MAAWRLASQDTRRSKEPPRDAGDLFIDVRDGSPRHVRVEAPDGTAADADLELSEELQYRLRTFGRALVHRAVSRATREVLKDSDAAADPAEATADDRSLGEDLFRAVLGDKLLYGRYSVWRARGGRLRVRLRVPTQLAWIPWELLRDPDERAWIALTNDMSLVREVDSRAPFEPARIGRDGLSVLGVGASPLDLPQLAVDQEKRIVEQALSGSGLLRWAAGDAAGALELLDDKGMNYHVFHFAGHGSYDASGGALFWGQEASQRLPVDKLASLLARHRSVRLVVLNACDSATGGEDADSPSIANRLVEQGVPAVLAMQAPVLDAAALAAARAFYRSLAQGVPVDDAATALRRALDAKGLDWAAPVLTVANATRPLFVRRTPFGWWRPAMAAAALAAACAGVYAGWSWIDRDKPIVPPPSGSSGDSGVTVPLTPAISTPTSASGEPGPDAGGAARSGDAGPGATCSDRTRNGEESDVDCGGDCQPCKVGLACKAPSDCVTSVCKSGKCAAAGKPPCAAPRRWIGGCCCVRWSAKADGDVEDRCFECVP